MQKTIYTPAYKNLIARLHQARLKAGLRQQDVARDLGISRTWLSKVEQGQLRLDLIQFVQLCRLYGVSTRELLHTMEEMLPSQSSNPEMGTGGGQQQRELP